MSSPVTALPVVALPVTVLSGFLGAGKTSLLRRMLGAPEMRGTAVILNEIEQAGSESLGAVPQDYLELTEACVCCVSHPELAAALERFSGRPDIARVVIETTGLADPLPLTFALRSEAVSRVARLDAVVTVVDPLNFSHAASEWRAQVEAADLVVVSKLDVASAAQRVACETEVARVHPGARVLAAQELEPALLFALERKAAAAGTDAHHHSDFRAVPLVFAAPVPLTAFEDALEALPTKVFRGKGWVVTSEGWIRFHLVGGRLDLELEAPPPLHGESRAIFFGRALTAEDLRTLVQ